MTQETMNEQFGSAEQSTVNERSGISGLLAALDYTPGRLDETAPAFIWLQVDTGDYTGDRSFEWPGSEEVTWQDESLGGLEIAYVRADLVESPQPVAGDAVRALPAKWRAHGNNRGPTYVGSALLSCADELEAALSTQPAPSEQVAASESGLPDRDPARSNSEQGLYRKFDVRRVDGSDAPGGKHDGCDYFVLDMTHDPFAPAAAYAYTAAAEAFHPDLATDMRQRYGLTGPFELAASVAVPDDGLFYIQDTRGFVGNCPMWWGPNRNGYVTRLDEAGRYTQAEAMEQHRFRETDLPWPCAEIDALARKTVDHQHMRPRSEQIAALRAIGEGT